MYNILIKLLIIFFFCKHAVRVGGGVEVGCFERLKGRGRMRSEPSHKALALSRPAGLSAFSINRGPAFLVQMHTGSCSPPPRLFGHLDPCLKWLPPGWRGQRDESGGRGGGRYLSSCPTPVDVHPPHPGDPRVFSV